MNIPKKSYFNFTEVCEVSDVKPYVLRYWESEFEDISPVSSESGQKLFKREDIFTILKIKDLLFNHKLSIPDARERLQNGDEREIRVQTEELSSQFAEQSNASVIENTFVTENISEIQMDESLEENQDILQSLLSAKNLINQIKEQHNW